MPDLEDDDSNDAIFLPFPQPRVAVMAPPPRKAAPPAVAQYLVVLGCSTCDLACGLFETLPEAEVFAADVADHPRAHADVAFGCHGYDPLYRPTGYHEVRVVEFHGPEPIRPVLVRALGG